MNIYFTDDLVEHKSVSMQLEEYSIVKGIVFVFNWFQFLFLTLGITMDFPDFIPPFSLYTCHIYHEA